MSTMLGTSGSQKGPAGVTRIASFSLNGPPKPGGFLLEPGGAPVKES
jgi:hypothetical protein